jgi:hypothetical protein
VGNEAVAALGSLPIRLVGQQIAEFRGRAGRPDAERNQGILDVEDAARELGLRRREDLSERALTLGVEVVIGRQHGHHLVIAALDRRRRQRDRGRRVPAQRLAQDAHLG